MFAAVQVLFNSSCPTDDNEYNTCQMIDGYSLVCWCLLVPWRAENAFAEKPEV